MRTYAVTLAVVVAGAAVSGRAGQDPPAPATAVPAAVQIASVTPKSVVAGAAFAVAVALPERYDGAITIAVHRVGLNLEQYRSVPLRDGDERDAAPEPGVIIHRVATDAKWTSALSLTSSGADRYLVSIEQPIVTQVDQVLTVVRTALAVDAGTVAGWLDNVRKAIESYQSVGTIARGKNDWSRYALGPSQAVSGDPNGAMYFVGDPTGRRWNAVYLRKPDVFSGLTYEAARSGAGTREQMTVGALLQTIQASQQQQMQYELTSVVAAIKALPPDAQTESLNELRALQTTVDGLSPW